MQISPVPFTFPQRLASDMALPKRVSYMSPRGIFRYPSLSTPDYGNENFPKPDGEFKVALICPLDDATNALITKLMPVWDEAISLGEKAFASLAIPIRKKLGKLDPQMFYVEEYDPETEEPTGNVIFKFKTKYKITDKKTKEVRYNRIGLFDAKGKSMEYVDETGKGTGKYPAIYGGSVGKVAFTARDYFVAGNGMAGLTLTLSGVQVIDLVSAGARSASSYGFGEEDGYEASDSYGGVDDTTGLPDGGATGSTNGNPEDF